MKTDFDQQIDSLLRQGARRERASSGTDERGEPRADSRTSASQAAMAARGAHLDADELSAYAGNALPAATRTHYAAHLADCAACRRTVTQLALAAGLPAQLETQAEAAREQSATTFTWRQRFGALVAPRAWRYAVPALVLLLVGAIALSVLRRAPRENTSVARMNERASQRPPEMQHAPPDAGAPANSNSADTANGSVNNTTTGNAPNAANSDAPVGKTEVAVNNQRAGGMPPKVAGETKDESPASSPGAVAAAPSSNADAAQMQATPAPVMVARAEPEEKPKATQPPATEPTRTADNSYEVDGATPRDEVSSVRRNGPARSERSSRAADTRAGSSSNSSGAGETRGMSSAPPPPAETRARRREDEDAEADDKKKQQQRAESSAKEETRSAQLSDATRTVGGRKFRRAGGGWIDTAYNSQPVTVVRRDSEQYRALTADEPGLRNIADTLGGDVTVIWKGRAYRFK